MMLSGRLMQNVEETHDNRYVKHEELNDAYDIEPGDYGTYVNDDMRIW